MPKKESKPSKPKTINGVNYESIEEEKEIVTEKLSELNEEKHATFLRLAKPRTQKCLDAFRILGNCSNKSSYAYTEDEIGHIFETLYEGLTKTHDKFRLAQTGQKKLFEF